MYCGIEVNSGQITMVTDKADDIIRATGNLVDFSEQPSCDEVTPQITKETAFEAAVRAHKEKAQLSAACEPKVGLRDTLIVDPQKLDRTKEAVLITAYKVLTTTLQAGCSEDKKISAFTHYVDTHTGEVIVSVSAIQDAKPNTQTNSGKGRGQGKGKGKGGGRGRNNIKKIKRVDLKGGNLKREFLFCKGRTCDFRPLDVETQEANSTWSQCTLNKPYLALGRVTTFPYIEEFTFDCQEHVTNNYNQLSGDEINGGFSPLTDVAFCGQQTYKMHQKYDLVATPAVFPMLTVTNLDELNAFYGELTDGSPVTIFGNGDGVIAYPLTSCDIVAHEFGHGFTAQYSKLEYIGESGGLNEAYSDVVGIAIKDMLYNVQDFLIGDMIMVQDGAFLRDMCNPTVDGYSIDHYDNYYDGIDVHFSSGIVNKMACLMYKANAFKIKELFVLFSVANRDFWTPTSTFNEAVCGLLGAETALYDEEIKQEAIKTAASSVGLECSTNMQY